MDLHLVDVEKWYIGFLDFDGDRPDPKNCSSFHEHENDFTTASCISCFCADSVKYQPQSFGKGS